MDAASGKTIKLFVEPMNIVIIYDRVDLALATSAILASAASRAGEASPINVKPWRLDLLGHSSDSEAAVNDAADAHIVVLALHMIAELPAALRNWLEEWAACRQVQDAALAIFDGREERALSSIVRPTLSRFARRHGLSFISDDITVPDEESSGYGEDYADLHYRKLAQTAVLQNILIRSARSYSCHWGINE